MVYTASKAKVHVTLPYVSQELHSCSMLRVTLAAPYNAPFTIVRTCVSCCHRREVTQLTAERCATGVLSFSQYSSCGKVEGKAYL
jgi:hypothetical protein